MGDTCEQAEMPKDVGFIGKRMRTDDDVICEIAYERREVANNLEKLKRAISVNPDFISENQKELWKKQAAAMEEYKRILGERIKDLLGE